MELDKRLIRPDYSNCIANIPNSVMRHFGAETVGDTLPILDRYLEKRYKNVVFLILDGMGKYILEETLGEDGFFRSNMKDTITSVFLATTVAATTSAITGLQPCEHSWLGWDIYYPSVDKNVTVYLNTIQGTDIPAADHNVARATAPYESAVERIIKAGGKAYDCYPYSEPYPDTLEKICGRIEELCALDGEKYIYAYWNEPDGMLHRKGRGCDEVRLLLEDIEKTVYSTAKKLDDTLLVITADHGHINNRSVYLKDYPAISDCLVRLPSLEPRVLNMFVKPGKEDVFVREFNKCFGEDFQLLTMDDALDMKLFGTGKKHSAFRSMLGNYIALATGDLSIYFTDENWVSMHGSMTPDEMLIPLIIYECKRWAIYRNLMEGPC